MAVLRKDNSAGREQRPEIRETASGRGREVDIDVGGSNRLVEMRHCVFEKAFDEPATFKIAKPAYILLNFAQLARIVSFTERHRTAPYVLAMVFGILRNALE